MVYKTGFVNNSHQLTQVIHAVMRDAGWSLQAALSSDGTDSVFYSSGENGAQDIYIRVAAKQADHVSQGDIQFYGEDGYTGFVNFFAYQFFKKGGSSSHDGYNEIGRFGPLLYKFNDDDADLYEYNFGTDAIDDGGTPATVIRRTLREGANSSDGEFYHVFDGHRFMWHTNTNGALAYFDLAREEDSVFASNRTSNGFVSSGIAHEHAVVYSRRGPLEPMIWKYRSGANGPGWHTFNARTEEVVGDTSPYFYSAPPWGTGGSTGAAACQGMRRDGKKYIYVFRGFSTTSWARYDIDDDDWDSLSPNLPASAHNGLNCILVPKEASGYSQDRIYVSTGNNSTNFYSIAIKNDGLPDTSEGWKAHASVPFVVGNEDDKMFHLGGRRIFFMDDGNRNLYFFKLPQEAIATGEWSQDPADIENPWFINNTDDCMIGAHYHLCSRVHTTEFGRTQYWVLADKDRVIALTETKETDDFNDQTFCYAGLFETDGYNIGEPLTQDTLPGGSTVFIDDTSNFKIGSSYRIANVVGIIPDNQERDGDFFDGYAKENFAGIARRELPHEIVTIQNISSSSLTLTSPVKSWYPAGSKIGEEIQPVGLWVDSMDRIQTLNMTPGSSSDGYASGTPSAQWSTVQQAQLSQQTRSERVDGTNVWPYLLAHSGINTSKSANVNLTEADSRGRLKGVFRGSSDVISLKGTIEINGKTYKRFDVWGHNFQSSPLMTVMVIGPLE